LTVDTSTEFLIGLFHELRKLLRETEWIEFKRNNDDQQQIGPST